MKKYLINTASKFWIPNRAKTFYQVLALALFISPFALSAPPNKKIYNESEKAITTSVLNQFKKECTHISILDESKLQEIQNFYNVKKPNMSKEQQECLESNLTQLVATHNIYKQTCDEVTSKKSSSSDADVSRLFVNAKKFQNGIRSYHEKLNECLIRNGAQRDVLLPYSDYEANNRALSRKLREMDLHQPFEDNGVQFR